MRRPIALPDLGVAQATFGFWLVQPGEAVLEGERIAEVLVGAATVELVSPADGQLDQALAQPGDLLQPGQTLGYVRQQ